MPRVSKLNRRKSSRYLIKSRRTRNLRKSRRTRSLRNTRRTSHLRKTGKKLKGGVVPLQSHPYFYGFADSDFKTYKQYKITTKRMEILESLLRVMDIIGVSLTTGKVTQFNEGDALPIIDAPKKDEHTTMFIYSNRSKKYLRFTNIKLKCNYSSNNMTDMIDNSNSSNNMTDNSNSSNNMTDKSNFICGEEDQPDIRSFVMERTDVPAPFRLHDGGMVGKIHFTYNYIPFNNENLTIINNIFDKILNLCKGKTGGHFARPNKKLYLSLLRNSKANAKEDAFQNVSDVDYHKLIKKHLLEHQVMVIKSNERSEASAERHGREIEVCVSYHDPMSKNKQQNSVK
jgi:hypothetical protein